MKSILLVLLCSLVCFSSSQEFSCNPDDAAYYAAENDMPIDMKPKIQFVDSVPYGKKYLLTINNTNINDPEIYPLIHLWGTPYQMGYAMGSLCKQQIQRMVADMWYYYRLQTSSFLPDWMPQWLLDLVGKIGFTAAMDLSRLLTRSYTPSHILEELDGISAGADVDYTTLLQIHLYLGQSEGSASLFGAWGKATASGGLLHMSALDWTMKSPLRDHTGIIVYHPDEIDGQAFINIGFVGVVGTFAGVSASQVAVSCIGVTEPDSSFGSDSRVGTPFMFVLRDILQFDDTVDDSITRLAAARRSGEFLIGVSDGKMGEFRGFQYSPSVLRVFDDSNLLPYNRTWHPRKTNIVYWTGDWNCPPQSQVFAQQLQTLSGRLSPQTAIKSLSSVARAGDVHVVYFDEANNVIYVSFAPDEYTNEQQQAYSRQFVRLSVKDLLMVSQ